MPLSPRIVRLRTHNILRVILKRILEAEGWFTIPEVSLGVDASLMPHVVPEGGRRLIRKLHKMGHLEVKDKKYQVKVSSLGYLASLVPQNKRNARRLDVFLMTDCDALPFEEDPR